LTQRRKYAVAGLSLFSNTFLVVAKTIVGLSIGSVAVLSEAIHSGIDLIASGITYIAVRKSGEPADISHPFGHGKIEDISGAMEAFLIFIAACWIIYEAVGKLLHPQPLVMAWWGIGVMGVSSIVNLFVSRPRPVLAGPCGGFGSGTVDPARRLAPDQKIGRRIARTQLAKNRGPEMQPQPSRR